MLYEGYRAEHPKRNLVAGESFPEGPTHLTEFSVARSPNRQLLGSWAALP